MAAPRVTPEHLERLIVEEDYLFPPESTMTICVLTLFNGFRVTGESACVAPENFDPAIGRKMARENAVEKLCSLEGYRLRSLMAAAEAADVAISEHFIARVAHEVNRAYCAHLGDGSQPPWEEAPDWQIESCLKGVQAVRAHPEMTPEQSHHNWCATKRMQGWVWGPVKDPAKQEHPCLVAYESLPPEQKAKDALFLAVVRTMLTPATPHQFVVVHTESEGETDG